MDDTKIQELKSFVKSCQSDPSILHNPSLGFFKTYLQSLGAKIPPASTPMGDLSIEVTDESRELAQDLKSKALEAISEGKLDEAMEHLTEAITLNPSSAILYATRASVFVKLRKPNAAIRDADAALQINADSAKGYKMRGMARAMLGLWEDAAHDLGLASNLDHDEEIGSTLKKIEPNVHKIKEHQRKYERLRREKKTKATEQKTQAETEMGDLSIEVTDESRELAQYLKSKSLEAISEGKLDEAVEHLTEAITLNPSSVILYATRASVFVKLRKPRAAIRDADAALQINADSAKGYKMRGMARAMLGLWEDAARDLGLASNLDHDEEIDSTLKKIKLNVHKIKEHRKYERLRREKKTKATEQKSQAETEDAENGRTSNEDIIESDLELDDSDVVKPDDDPPQKMGDLSIEVTDESRELAQDLKSKALEAISEGKLDEAMEHLTEAITLNPSSAILYATRASAFVKLRKPNAAIRDADAALQINADSAKGYKMRGMSRAMLGLWEDATHDLGLASNLDHDEEIGSTLKKSELNVHKIKEHRRKYERLRREKKTKATEQKSQAETEDAENGHTSNEDIIESDLELDDSDVVKPDDDPPQKMGDLSIEVTDESRELAQDLKSKALEAISEGKLDEAIEHLTEAITLNPCSAILYTTRASAFVKLRKPNAAVRDADAALQINADSAKGYKMRGMARAMLGLWEDAARDLGLASSLDHDEEIGSTLKKIEPNFHKIKEHRRKYERLRREKKTKAAEQKSQAETEHVKASAQTYDELLTSEAPPVVDGLKFELHTLPVDGKKVPDGDGVNVYVNTADARESSLVPEEVLMAEVERTIARAHRNYTMADALQKQITDAGYRVLNINNEEILARKYRIRLRGIDAPENAMPYGKEAKDELVKIVDGKCLQILVFDEDRYGRFVGDVYCNGICVQKRMLKKGLAWHYTTYDKRPEFAKLEKDARAKGIGLWASSNPEMPWEWRKNHREN